MCGLTGWISTHSERFGDDAERALTPMQRALVHRGPDGYGAHVDSCIEWDGRSDCMSQFVSDSMRIDGGFYGSFDEPEEFYESDDYTQKMKGAGKLMYQWFGKTWMNRKLNAIRDQAPEETVSEAPPVVAGGGR